MEGWLLNVLAGLLVFIVCQSSARSAEQTNGVMNSVYQRGVTKMDLVIAFLVFVLSFGAGYAARERKSRMRSRRYYQNDSLG